MEKIELDPEERKIWEEALLKFCKHRDPYTKDNVHKTTVKVGLARALSGWEKRCPKDFGDRLKQVFSIKKQDFLIYFMRDGKLDQYAPPPEDTRVDEQDYLKTRRKLYGDEYELDRSGDQALLEVVLLEELKLYRIRKDIERNPTLKTDYSEAITKTTKNLVSAQKALGIARIDRLLEQKVPQGSVANLSLKFEEKVKELRRVREEEIGDEKLLMKIKEQREIVNKVTEGDIEGILRVIEDRYSAE